MNKLTPTTILMIIGGIGLIFFAMFYYRKKKRASKALNKTVSPPNDIIKNAPEIADTDTFQPMVVNQQGRQTRLVKTPVGFALN